jgi:hypothetical protein
MKLYHVSQEFYKEKTYQTFMRYIWNEEQFIKIWETITLLLKTLISQFYLNQHLMHIITEEYLNKNQKIT